MIISPLDQLFLGKKIKRMKKIALFILSCVCALTIEAQTGQSVVRGYVVDAINTGRLSGASIKVLGSTKGAVANEEGYFELFTQPGKVQLQISYLGYRDTTLILDVAADRVSTIRVILSSGAPQLTSVLISGYLQGQAKALNQQRNADNIKNVVSADQIGRFPDPNAAEALQRVPGVNIERDQGEGRYVLIRGLAPQFTNISVNGEQIPSPEADVRYVALDVIPSDQLASIEVSKSLTPDMDGDAVGGSVNLITRMAQSAKPRINGSLVGGYNALMNKPNLQGQLQFDQRFGQKQQLGVMVNGNYYHNHLGSDNWEQSPDDNEVELRDYELIRTRMGLSSTIDYRFNDRNEIYFRSLYSKFTDREWRRRYVFIPNDDEIRKLTKDRFESQSVMTFNLGGRHTFKSFYLNYEGQYSDAEQNTPYDHEARFTSEQSSSISFSGPDYPIIDAPGFQDNSQYEFDEVSYGSSLAKDRNITGKFEIGIPYTMKNSSGLVKFGGKYRGKKKSYIITQDVYEANGGVPTLDNFDEAPIKDEFLEGRYDMGRPLYMSAFNQYFNANPGLFELDVEAKSIDEALEAYDAEENVMAAFAMARHQFRKLMILGGVRYERTSVNYNSKDVVIDGSGDLSEIVPVSGTSNYDFVLPQFQARYQLGEYTNLRAAATYSYARPNFSEIIPAQEINIEDNVATLGNAALKPTGSLNLDLMIEKYFSNVGVVSAGIFHKSLNDFIYRRVQFNVPYPSTGTPIVPSIDVVQAQNGNDAQLTGIELVFQRKLSFLPGFLKYFNIYSNYTYTHSKATIQSRDASSNKPNATEIIRLPGQAMHVGNVALAYETSKLLVRIAANFNGEYLSEVGGSPDQDLYVNRRLQLDLNASYSINTRFRVFAEFLNLTNQPYESYFGNKDVTAQREFYSWWTRLGLKFDLGGKK
jgi:TonB-dependent receptor